LAVVVVDGVGFVGIRGCGRGCWSRVGWSRVLSAPLPGVTLPASPECLSPQSRGWLLGGWCVACVWSWLLLMSWVIRVFEVVGVVVGRGVGCPGGRGRCWWCVLRWCSTLWAWLLAEDCVVVRVVAGRSWCGWSGLFPCSMVWFIRWPRIGSLYWPVRGRFWCRWGWLFVCSMMWARLLAADWVVVLAVVVVDGVFHKSVRRCGCSCWPRCGWSRVLLAPLALALPVRLRRNVLRHCFGAWCVVDGVLPTRGRLVAVAGVDGAGYECVQGCGRGCWPSCGSWCW